MLHCGQVGRQIWGLAWSWAQTRGHISWDGYSFTYLRCSMYGVPGIGRGLDLG
jgi:hypothetical protein